MALRQWANPRKSSRLWALLLLLQLIPAGPLLRIAPTRGDPCRGDSPPPTQSRDPRPTAQPPPPRPGGGAAPSAGTLCWATGGSRGPGAAHLPVPRRAAGHGQGDGRRPRALGSAGGGGAIWGGLPGSRSIVLVGSAAPPPSTAIQRPPEGRGSGPPRCRFGGQTLQVSARFVQRGPPPTPPRRGCRGRRPRRWPGSAPAAPAAAD